ncbi:MAG: hypothetical protein GEU99_14105 [Luteitalea sp.]|nr:hypothetical protein [Luteitalea sp.]
MLKGDCQPVYGACWRCVQAVSPSAASLQKDLTLAGRTRFQVRLDVNNVLKTWNFNPPNTTVNLENPETFGKVTSNPVTANFGGVPLMNLSVKVMF